MQKNKDIFVAIPAYNAAHTIVSVINDVHQYLDLEQILVVNDGSQDSTGELVKQCGVNLLNHAKNIGKGAALRTAFDFFIKQTTAHALITLDADKQHAPSEIPKFMDFFLKSRCDLIIGARDFSFGVMPLLRIISNTITSKLLSLKLKQRLKDSQSGYRLYSRRLILNLRLLSTGYETESEILLQACRAKMSINSIPIETIYAGELSHIRMPRDIIRFIKVYIKN